ncbi:TPA: tautomerase family protein [Klebsiella pneumoniae]
MPLTRISLGTAWRPAEFAQLSALFHECLVAEFDVPSADRFQFIERAVDEQRIYDPHYLSEGRSARFVLFHIFAGKPRSRAQKQGLYRRLCARLDDEMAVSPQDVMVVIQFNQLEDWSFSAGKMADE